MSKAETATTPDALTSALVIPRKAVIEGAISFDGSIVLDGVVHGDVRCTSIIINERGCVEGSVIADVVTVLGDVNGEIYANQLTLKTACSVAGGIFHKKLVLEDGCFFEGRSRRHTTPLLLAPA